MLLDCACCVETAVVSSAAPFSFFAFFEAGSSLRVQDYRVKQLHSIYSRLFNVCSMECSLGNVVTQTERNSTTAILIGAYITLIYAELNATVTINTFTTMELGCNCV